MNSLRIRNGLLWHIANGLNTEEERKRKTTRVDCTNKWSIQMTPEGKVKAAIVKILKQYGVYYFFPIGYAYGRSGIPDIIGCYEGAFLSIEVKATEKKKMSALQVRESQAIQNAGGWFILLHKDNLDELVELLDELQNSTSLFLSRKVCTKLTNGLSSVQMKTG